MQRWAGLKAMSSRISLESETAEGESPVDERQSYPVNQLE